MGQTRMDKHPSMTSGEKPTVHATPRAKQFRDDIEALKEFDEGDEFVRQLEGDLRNVPLACRVLSVRSI